MFGVRGGLDPPCGLTGSVQAATPTTNRLRRSQRRTPQTRTPQIRTQAEGEPPRTGQPEFKTPTRIQGSRAEGGFSAESPHNDSDFQQDIIWDATSPSPNRLSRRGRKQPSGVVNISEIVNRIAPEHGRPKVAEPTLQRWIGDSADIPCTPDVQAPKPKKKSPRPNAVDDLLKLARQFDFTMFRQDEEEVNHLLPQDSHLEDFSASAPGDHQPPAADLQADLDLQMEDDFELLFDGPTQHVSRSISQPSQVRRPHSESVRAPAPPHVPVAPTADSRGAADHDFEDDWDDDLLNDSLVLQVTQNPPDFPAPTLCSTQKPQSPVYAPTGPAETPRQRSTFRLESNPRFSVNRGQTTNPNQSHGPKAAETDSQSSRPAVCDGPKKPGPQLDQRTPAAPQGPQRPAGVSSHQEMALVSDLLDDDLNSFFSSDLVWDDPVDDDLLCEVCEDVENQIQTHVVPTKQTPTSTNKAALQPALRPWDTRSRQPANQKPFPPKQTPQAPPAAPGSWCSGGLVSNVDAGVRHTQAASRVQPVPHRNVRKEHFTFKKPNNPVSTATNKVLGKCSAAEIELKKQQAMERRRQRQAVQNLRAPT